MRTTEGVTAALARFVAETAHDAIPPPARARAVDALSDGLGVLLAGSRSMAGTTMRRYVMRGGGGESSLIPGPDRVPPELAALANGTSAHALDFDDTTHPAHAHPTAVLFPAAFAAAQLRGASGRELVTAYLLGFEVESALGRGLNLGHYRAGWHATSTFGAFGAAAAASRVLGADAARTETALGIAASSAGGLMANFGTLTKPLHAGLAAAAGVRAAILATMGWTAARGVIEDARGFAAVLRGSDEPRLDSIAEGLGERWTILEPYGLALKAYPACGATHPALDAALVLHRRVAGRSIRRVSVGTTALLPTVVTEHDPWTSEAARFSLEYVLAAALTFGRMTLAELQPAVIADPKVRDLMSRVDQAVDTRVAESREYGAVVRIELDDGTSLEQRADTARGKNSNPLSRADLRAKFDSCVGPAADELWQAVHDLDDGGASLDRLATRLARLPVPASPAGGRG
jgi:2-methylcitrate dehydratase PrpD